MCYTPFSMFSGSVFLKFLQIAQCALKLTDVVPKASKLFATMLIQGGNKTSILHQMKKLFQRYP